MIFLKLYFPGPAAAWQPDRSPPSLQLLGARDWRRVRKGGKQRRQGVMHPPASHSHLPASSRRQLFPGAVLTGCLYPHGFISNSLHFAKTKATLSWPKFLTLSSSLEEGWENKRGNTETIFSLNTTHTSTCTYTEIYPIHKVRWGTSPAIPPLHQGVPWGPQLPKS